MTVVNALSLWAPYGTLIVQGVKGIETRGRPPGGFGLPGPMPGRSLTRGDRIAVHQTAKCVTGAIGDFDVEDDTLRGTPKQFLLRDLKGGGWPYRLPLGAIVGTVRVVDAVPIARFDSRASGVIMPSRRDGWLVDTRELLYEPIWNEIAYGDYSPGRWAWMLDDPVPCSPIPCKGRQGVWSLPGEISERLSG